MNNQLFFFQVSRVWKTKVCIISTILVYAYQGILAFPGLAMFRVNPKNKICEARNYNIVSNYFFMEIHGEINSFANALVPILFVFIFTGMTIFKIRQMGKKHDRNGSSRNNQNKRDSEITRQMIVVCLLFGFLSSIVVFGVRELYNNERTAYGYMRLNLFERVISISLALINSGNFYAYIIFGDKFRANFVSLFTGGPINYTTKSRTATPGENN